MRVEHEYRRLEAWAYLAALDVRRFRPVGRSECKDGIARFDRLAAQTMKRRAHRQVRRMFCVDNGTAHRGPAAGRRLRRRFPDLVLVHGPTQASRLNEIEIYFSGLERKTLRSNDLPLLPAIEVV